MSNTVCGYLVVRKAEENYRREQETPIVGLRQLRAVGGKIYHGINREPWSDVWSACHRGLLSERLIQQYKEIELWETTLGVSVCDTLETARDFINALKGIDPRNEIICIASEQVESITGIRDIPSAEISWLGFDAYALPWMSLIDNGVFHGLVVEFQSQLNEFGLFDDQDTAKAYMQEYVRQSETFQKAEPIPYDEYTLFPIRVGAIT